MAGSVTQRTHSPSFWKAIDCIGWAGSFPRTNGQNRSIAFRSANELGFAPRPCRSHASRKFFFFQRETASLLAARISLQSKPRRASDLNPCEGCLRILLQRNGKARRSAYSQQLTVRTAADSKDGRVLDEDAHMRSRVEVRELYDLTDCLVALALDRNRRPGELQGCAHGGVGRGRSEYVPLRSTCFPR